MLTKCSATLNISISHLIACAVIGSFIDNNFFYFQTVVGKFVEKRLCKVLGGGSEFKRDESESLVTQCLLGGGFQRAFFVQKRMVKTVCEGADCGLEVGKVDEHPTLFACEHKLLRADIDLYRPAVTVEIRALAFIACEKMCAVK